MKNHEKATPASTKDNVSVRSTDTAKTYAQAGPAASTHEVSVPGTDRGNTNESKICSLILLATQNLRTNAVSGFGASKLDPRFIGPFTVAERHGGAYTLELLSDLRLRPTFCVGRLKPYVQLESSSCDDSPTTTSGATSAFQQASSPSPEEGELVPTSQHGYLRWSERLRPRKPSARSAAASAHRSEQPERSQEPPRGRGTTEDCGQPGVDHMMSVRHRRQKHNSVRGTIHADVDRIVDHTNPKTNRSSVCLRIRWRQSAFFEIRVFLETS
ncbi:Pol Polyprotein [Phytophthora megakarya]|uniref:Pol Polyprotein n=1 Tax=Phytophthora megakarya TaxID=4795 RepID=A0A225WNI7_9STRA|nr:Pol Polyprotein [Phytophthora megakarya]